MAKKSKKRVNVYQEVTDRVIEQLEQGAAPWVRPWASAGLNKSARTGKPYRGVNQLLLMMSSMLKGFSDDRWITFKQAKDLGGHVKKGSKGTGIVFWKFENEEKRDSEGNAILGSDGEPLTERKLKFVKFFTVFNVEQCEDLDESKLPETVIDKMPGADSLPEADEFVKASGARIRHGGSKAAYSLLTDSIRMPKPKQFEDTGSYYSTVFHELTHWTGREGRCNREFGERFGDDAYAAEELVAEMGSAFLCALFGAEGRLQHPEYLDHWLKVLRADNKAIFTASSKAQQSVDFLQDKAGTKTAPQAGEDAHEGAEEVSEAA